MNPTHKTLTLKPVEAIILAAGQSQRMGEPKLVLPWGQTTVIGAVIQALVQGGLELGLQGILVVTGGHRHIIESFLQQYASPIPLRWTFNPHYEGEMTFSLQEGLRQTSPTAQAVLIALGDQPQILPSTVHSILKSYQEEGRLLIAPSYQMRRGHPWLVARPLWRQLLALEEPHTLRDFFAQYADQVHYILVETPTILKDLDTPQDYQREKPA